MPWDAAPDCTTKPEGANASYDANGRLWGYQDGKSCKFNPASANATAQAASTAQSSGASASSAAAAQAVAVSWDAAPACVNTKPEDGVKDVQGRPWGFENGEAGEAFVYIMCCCLCTKTALFSLAPTPDLSITVCRELNLTQVP